MRKILFLVFFQFMVLTLVAQDPLRFEKEINNFINSESKVNKKELILFTGSSSIGMWKDLKSDFPKHNVLNRGFGGSHMSDLYYLAKPVILNYNPSRIFIYEGDNDISSGKTPEEVLQVAERLLNFLRSQLPADVKIIFISAKPSISRWHLKGKYEDFNRQLKEWTATRENVLYADVWTPMLDAHGEVFKDIFLKDNLHMNRKGYDIWKGVIEKFMP